MLANSHKPILTGEKIHKDTTHQRIIKRIDNLGITWVNFCSLPHKFQGLLSLSKLKIYVPKDLEKREISKVNQTNRKNISLMPTYFHFTFQLTFNASQLSGYTSKTFSKFDSALLRSPIFSCTCPKPVTMSPKIMHRTR